LRAWTKEAKLARMSEPRVVADRILIVLLGAIGDVTRGLPFVTRLRRGYPEAKIAWAVEPIAAPLVHGHPALDEVIVFDRPRWPWSVLPFLRQVRRFRPDLTIDLQSHLKSGVITRWSGAPVRLGFHRDNSREGNWRLLTDHVGPFAELSSKLKQFLAFGDWLGLPAAPVDFGLALSGEESARVESLLADVPRPFIAAFLGSSCESRLWFADRTAAVIDRAARRGIATVLVGGPGDVELAAEVEKLAQARVWNLAGKTSLRDLFGIFRHARAAFGPDSGPMHIAAAVGCRVVSLWGATSAARSAPWQSEELVIEGHADCSPCYRKSCPIGRQCMQTIAVERVAQSLLNA
jgi:ADP-heptose:LPS heptosyltransferase